MKPRPERAKDKVPHDVRQRYVNMFTEEFLKTTPTVKDSFEKVGAPAAPRSDDGSPVMPVTRYLVTRYCNRTTLCQ